MYRAKQERRGQMLYARELDMHSPERLGLMGELRAGIDSGQLELHYQPKIDLRKRMATGVEALVRWRHPRLGLIGPDRFVPLAEVSDLIRPLSLWVLERALRGWRSTTSAPATRP